jgi:enamine deaminase RidA (YjgF/YER057c/UK114 family)
MKRRTYSSGSPWEPLVGYSRAVRVGPFIHVAGTTASDADGQVIGEGDPYAQMKFALAKIERALGEAGGEMRHVVRTRTFVTDISRWEEIGRAHGEVFREIRPASTMVEVRALIDPRMLVEVEVDAIVDEEAGAMSSRASG